MTQSAELTRRTMLAAGGAGAVGSVIALAGCAPATDDAAPSTTPAASPSPSETSGAEPPPETSAPADAGGTDVAALADIPVGGSIDATIDGEPALIAQPSAGEVVAFSAICTHQQCVVAAAGSEFRCPCHGSVFAADTGEPTNGPALEPLASIAVAVSGDRVVATG